MICNFLFYVECFIINNCEFVIVICFSNYIDEEIDIKIGYV